MPVPQRRRSASLVAALQANMSQRLAGSIHADVTQTSPPQHIYAIRRPGSRAALRPRHCQTLSPLPRKTPLHWGNPSLADTFRRNGRPWLFTAWSIHAPWIAPGARKPSLSLERSFLGENLLGSDPPWQQPLLRRSSSSAAGVWACSRERPLLHGKVASSQES